MPGSPSSIAAKFLQFTIVCVWFLKMILQIMLLSLAVAQDFSPPLLASKVKVSESGVSRK